MCSDSVPFADGGPGASAEGTATTRHVPVMVEEILEGLAPRPGAVILDGTVGGGGHAAVLARAVTPGGRIVAVDRDPAALARARSRLAGLPVTLAHAAFDEVEERGLVAPGSLDGILLDLGLSSDQLADTQRGFSFSADGPLDLRFDPDSGEPAWALVARLSERELADLIYRYGQERFSRRVARRIVAQRRAGPIRTAAQLARIVREVVPRSRGHRIDPATRTFQALRIAVNDELGRLERALAALPNWLRPGGRVAILSFHGLEDRLVKQSFRSDPRLRPLTKKPLRPSQAEIAANPRSRSARLRIAERLPTDPALTDRG